MELLMIRHSSTRGNLLRQYVGSQDHPLAPEGGHRLPVEAVALLHPVGGDASHRWAVGLTYAPVPADG